VRLDLGPLSAVVSVIGVTFLIPGCLAADALPLALRNAGRQRSQVLRCAPAVGVDGRLGFTPDDRSPGASAPVLKLANVMITFTLVASRPLRSATLTVLAMAAKPAPRSRCPPSSSGAVACAPFEATGETTVLAQTQRVTGDPGALGKRFLVARRV
jgi:hypothetical protein